MTAVGEYKEVAQRRSVRAGKMLSREMAKVLEDGINDQRQADGSVGGKKTERVSFEYAEEVTQRMGWCRARSEYSTEHDQSGMVRLPDPNSDSDLRSQITSASLPSLSVSDMKMSTSGTRVVETSNRSFVTLAVVLPPAN